MKLSSKARREPSILFVVHYAETFIVLKLQLANIEFRHSDDQSEEDLRNDQSVRSPSGCMNSRSVISLQVTG